jgi:molybdopterin synthase sulfur carrier subunit
MSTVRIPVPLRKFTDGADEVAATGATVTEVIDDLERSHPGTKARLCEDDGKIRRFVNIYVNDEDIRFMQNLDTPVSDGDELSIVPAIAGGRAAR